MTAAASFFLGLAVPFAVANWVAVARGESRVVYATKPATLAALVAAAATLDPADPSRRWWFVAALVFSLAGDVFLMLPRDLFVAGLASFLVAHVLYILGFGLGEAWPAVLLVLVVSAPVGWWILRSLVRQHRELVGPVVAYMAVISLMVAAAIGSGIGVAIAGASLFYASDALIAINRFVRPLAWAPVAIMVTYHLGQLGLVLSLV